MKIQVLLLVITMLISVEVNCQQSILDFKFAPFFRLGRQSLTRFIQPKTFDQGFQEIMKQKKVQRQFSNDTPFFCDVNGHGARSKTVPKSVHMLRLGDIDIVGAIGDSLTAGNGIFALNELQVLLEGRGASWSIGGLQSWRQFLTVPNIIKEFNPNLYGFSIAGQAYSYERVSRFNVAEVGVRNKKKFYLLKAILNLFNFASKATASDTVHQARNIIKRMRNDPKVNMKKHWKLLTYMIGANDFCLDICYHQDQNKVIEKGANALTLTLRILRENLPRTLVNVVLPPDVSILLRFTNKPDTCKSLHYLECPCLFSLNHQTNRNRTIDTINRSQAFLGSW